MRVYRGQTTSTGVVVGPVSLITRSPGRPLDYNAFLPAKEKSLLDEAIVVAQQELGALAGRITETESPIFSFQRLVLEDNGFLEEIYAYINSGVCASEAVNRVGQRYAARLQAMEEVPYLQQRGVDILDACQRVVNILNGRSREALTVDHPVIIAADSLMPSDLFRLPTNMILGVVTSEGSNQSHAAIIARALGIPGIIQVGRDFLEDCDGHIAVLDADKGEVILDPDCAAQTAVISRLCLDQHRHTATGQLLAAPCLTRDGTAFELTANCFGPEDISSALHNGAQGIGLLRSGYLLMADHTPDEQEQYAFYVKCLRAAGGKPVCVRTFDFCTDQTMASANGVAVSTALGLRGIRHGLLYPRLFENQICALLRAGLEGPLQVMFPMVGDVREWDAVMRIVERCRQKLRERGVPFDSQLPFGLFLSIPAACLSIREFIRHGCRFITIGSNDLIQFMHAADRNISAVEAFYRPTSKAMCKLLRMLVDTAHSEQVPLRICGFAAGNPHHARRYLELGIRSFAVSPQSMLALKEAFLQTSLDDPGA